MSRISGKTLIITGASGGIGRALALGLADEKAGLVLNARGPEGLERIAEECAKKGTRVDFAAGSAALPEIADDLVDRAIKMGSFYGFIQLAGVVHPGPVLWELSTGQLGEIFEASVTASFEMARSAFPALIEAGEGIAVFFGSGAAERAVPGMGAYCVAKAAEEHLVRNLAAEAPEITSFVFRPGVVDTPMLRGFVHARGKAGEELRKQYRVYERNQEILNPDIPARALISILERGPGRFQGKIATWRDGI